jgi:hypothetical protein
VELLRVKRGDTFKVRFLTEVDGTLQHWVGKGSVPCQDESCPVKTHAIPRYYAGYASVERFEALPAPCWVACVLEVTESLLICFGEEVLRGTEWQVLQRNTRGTKSETYGYKTGNVDPRLLRSDIDYRPVVQRVYKGMPIRWGKTPLLSAPQIASVTPANAGGVAEPKQEASRGFVFQDDGLQRTVKERSAEYDRQKRAFLESLLGRGV